MKYIGTVLVLALGASGVSAASAFLQAQVADTALAGGATSMLPMVLAGLGMMLTIGLRCHLAHPNR